MRANAYTIRSEVWLYPGEAANWHFTSVPKKKSAVITENFGAQKRGWRSLPVQVTIGKTNWKTSIFPDKPSGTYLLPLKAEIRKKEHIRAGDRITFTIEIQVNAR